MAATDTTIQPAAPLVAPPAARRFGRLGDRALARLFISPALALLLFLSVFPLLWALYLSFTDYSATRDVPASWVGFENYVDILTSSAVHERAVTTAIYVVAAVGLQTVLGFSIAYLISRRARGRGLMTTLFLIPMMLSPVVVGLFWRFMLDTQFGVINSLLGSLGLGQVEWLTSQRLALFSVIIVDTWQWTPFIMLIALAGLTAVPRYLYKVAFLGFDTGVASAYGILMVVVVIILAQLLLRYLDRLREA